METVNIGVPVNLNSHLLIAGETGSGKSVLLNALITEIFIQDPYSRLFLFDLKIVEFTRYKKLMPVYTDINETLKALQLLHAEMMRKYKSMAETGIVENTENKTYIFVDEIAEITFHENKKAAKKINDILSSFARIGRAAGYILILSTQFPTAKVVSMQVKMNTQKLCLKCSSDIGYRIMLDKKYYDLNFPGECIYKDNHGNISHFQVIPATENYVNEFIKECEKYL